MAGIVDPSKAGKVVPGEGMGIFDPGEKDGLAPEDKFDRFIEEKVDPGRFKCLDGGKGIVVAGNGKELPIGRREKILVGLDLFRGRHRRCVKEIAGMDREIKIHPLNQKNRPLDHPRVEVDMKIGEVQDLESVEGGMEAGDGDFRGLQVQL